VFLVESRFDLCGGRHPLPMLAVIPCLRGLLLRVSPQRADFNRAEPRRRDLRRPANPFVEVFVFEHPVE
jgi:hypothetical protein